jgi:signal transduction histidine kinase
MTLVEFITENRNDILRLAREKITERKWPVTSVHELENGLPKFLSQVAETLQLKPTPDKFPSSLISDTAGKHGSQALAEGFSIAQVVHDYGDVCQAVTELAVEKKVKITAEDFQTFNLCLDNAIAGAVTEFSRQSDEMIGEGEAERLGHLTHELRNHLSTAMLSYAAVKTGKVAFGGSTGLILGRSLMGMRDLLDTTISEVRLAAGTAEPKRISLGRFMRDVEGAASLQAGQREVGVSFAPAPVDVMVNADPQLLSSAFFNLLQNAFKYTVPHGKVAVRALCEGGLVSIEVEDECGGLPQGNAEAFFTPFGARRGKDRTGLGLGLNISRKAVKSFGGDILVRNLPGKGCIFTIALPAVV